MNSSLDLSGMLAYSDLVRSLLNLVKICNRLSKLSWLRQFCLGFFAASDSLLTPDKWKCPCDLCFWCSALWCGVRTALLWLSDVVMITWAAWGLSQRSLFCGCWSLSGKLRIPVSFTQFDVRFDFLLPQQLLLLNVCILVAYKIRDLGWNLAWGE